MDCPEDPYETKRREMLSHMKPTRPAPPKTSLKQFLENDRKVLRFYCVWDDTRSAFGDARKMVLNYFLADDTIEIHEFIAPNSGRDAATGFLRRGKLPKRHKKIPDMVGQPEAYYTDRDLMIGTVLNFFGRPFLFCDCDEFTKSYYRERYDLHDFTPIPYDSIYIEDALLPAQPISFITPEYNGWGSEDDSLGNCLSLIPKPPKRDLHREQEFGNTILRFAGILNTHRPEDRERRFVISFHLSDNTVQVFEPHRRNTGILGGKFLERSKVKVGRRYLSTNDFYIGAELNLSAFPFILVGADEFALRFMDEHTELFPNHVKRGSNVTGQNIEVTSIEKGIVEAPSESTAIENADSKHGISTSHTN
ncbi:EF-hand domain-containing member C2 [Coelomomyces lativittatus]|nr:EF-hand domain-containing member C2 [Coelomomyces lativittatus]KAJ1509208.1 EF-hand domain-containing member C2 [Coelomomyces lativittatus]